MKILVPLLGFLYRISFQLLFNVVFNLYWLVHMTVYGKWYFSERKKALAITSFHDFVYVYDGIFKTGIFEKWPTWTALIGVTNYRNKIGNCQDGAWLIKKWLKVRGEKPKIRIYVKGLNPAKVHYIVESNEYVYDLTPVYNMRKRKGTMEELIINANSKNKIYVVQ